MSSWKLEQRTILAVTERTRPSILNVGPHISHFYSHRIRPTQNSDWSLWTKKKTPLRWKTQKRNEKRHPLLTNINSLNTSPSQSIFFSMLILLQRETRIYHPENLQNLDQATPSASVTNLPGIQVVASILGIFYLQQALSVLSLSYL